MVTEEKWEVEEIALEVIAMADQAVSLFPLSLLADQK